MAASVTSLAGHGMTLALMALLTLSGLKVRSVLASSVPPDSLHKAGDGVKALDLDRLVANIVRKQFNNTSGFGDKRPATIAGLFPSEVRIHFHGEPQIAALKDENEVQDLSSLATLLTLNALLEATVKGQLEKPDTAFLVQALEALSSFRSPLFGEKKSALLTLWPSQTAGQPEKWNTTSVNALKGGRQLAPFVILQKAVKQCDDHCPSGKAALKEVKDIRFCKQFFNESLSDFASRRNFPPDVTSSFANLALGALLHKGGDPYSPVFDVWKNSNAAFPRLLRDVANFAYRPALCSNLSNHVIDSRSYYIIESFLSQRNSCLSEDAAFVTNWVPHHLSEGRLVYGGRTLPVYNTLDFFGTATFLHAVTATVLQNLTTWDPSIVQTLIKYNLDLVAWVVSNGRSDHLDLLMTSHPSVYQFYWMLSRTLFDLENARLQQMETFQPLEEFYVIWNVTVRMYVTQTILSAIQDGGLDLNGNPLAYVDDVIGTNDVNNKGELQPSKIDRLFATATAASSLLSAWTVHNKQKKMLFLPNIPTDVALAVTRLVNYVTANYLSEDTAMGNIIYTTLHKHCQTLPYWFPANSVTTPTGSNFTGSDPTPEVLFGMRGPVASDQYKAMLSQPHFGYTLPQSMPGLNSTSALFFYWSSPVYTQAMSLLTVAQLRNVKGKTKSLKKVMNSFNQKAVKTENRTVSDL